MAENLILNAKVTDDKATEYRFRLEFYVFQDDGVYIAYCPSMDLSTSGNSFNEAVENFYECFQPHVECCVDQGTLFDDLVAHGWKLSKKGIRPPSFTSLMRKPEMKRLLTGSLGYERIVTPARHSAGNAHMTQFSKKCYLCRSI